MKTRPLLLLSGLVVASGTASATLVVDGSLDDWLISKTTWKSSVAGVHTTVEDQTGNGAFFLNPGWGGQAYDAEALYAAFQGNKLFVALITGHSPLTTDNPAGNSYGAGDFALDFGKNGSYELGINVIPGGFGTAGGVYKNPTWAYGLWAPNGSYLSDPAARQQYVDRTHPTSLTGGTSIGFATTQYTTTGVTGYGSKSSDPHYFYEFSVDLSLLREAGWDGSAFNIHWTENCANDSIMVDPGLYVPEPGALALLGVGLIGLIGTQRKRLPVR